jgi:integrase
MGVCKYTGVKGTGYGVDYALKGKRIRERVWSNKKEAAEYLGKKLKEIRDGKYREGPERVVPFEELAADYEKQTNGKKSFHNEEYYINTLLEHFTGKTLSELTVRDIELFQTERKESPTRAKNTRSGATVNREMACLRAMLNKAVLWDLIPKNPASKVKSPRERKGYRHGVLQVVTSEMRDIRVAWETAKKKAGISPDFRFHDLRHTFASHQKMAGTDDYTLMEIMGHSDHRMMRRYAHLTPEHKWKAVNSLPVWQKSVTFSWDDENCNRAITPQLIDIVVS